MSDWPVEYLHAVYKELVDIVGMENTEKLYQYYKGQQLCFPSRIYDKHYVKQIIRERYDGTNVKEMAREFGYSERWVRKIIQEGQKV